MSFFKNSLFLGIGKALTAFSAILISVFLSRNLDYENYASYKQVFIIIKLATPFLVLGLRQTLFFYIPRDISNARKYLHINLTASLFLAVLFSVLFYFFQDQIISYFKNPLLALILPFIGIYFFFGLALPTFDTVFVCLKQTKQLMLYSSASKFVLLLGVIMLVFLGFKNFDSFVKLQFALSVLFFVIGYYWISRLTIPTSESFAFRDVYAHIKFSIPLGVSVIMSALAYNLDKLIVVGTATQKEFAIYANGAMEIPLLGIVTGTLVSVLLPEFARNAQDKNFSKIIELWNYKLSKTAIVIFPVFAFLMVYAEEFMVTLYGPKYEESAVVFRIFLLLLPLRIANYESIFVAFGKNKLILFRTALEIVFLIVLAYILNKIIGFYGVAWAFVLVTLVWSLAYNFFTIARLLNCKILNLLPLQDFKNIVISLLLPCILIVFFKRIELMHSLKIALAFIIFTSLLLMFYHVLGIVKLNDLYKKLFNK
jgi:O-antigen/teichoic acid export membrane protein